MVGSASVAQQETALTLDEWRESIGRSFVPMDVLPLSTTPTDFRAVVRRQQLGSVGVTLVRSDAHISVRTPRNISQHPADYYKVSCQIEGEGWVGQGGRRSLLGPGDVAIYNTSQPYELEFPGYSEGIIAQIPHSEFPVGPAHIDRLSARVLGSSGLSPTLAALLRLIAQGGTPPSGAPRHHLARSLVELVAATVIDELGRVDTVDSANDALLSSIKRYARAHLSNPELTLDAAASAHYVSTRTAQRLFQAAGTTFAAWLRAERLELAQQRLLTSTEPVTGIALDVGFVSVTHFSTVFREHFGISARALRLSHSSDSDS